MAGGGEQRETASAPDSSSQEAEVEWLSLLRAGQVGQVGGWEGTGSRERKADPSVPGPHFA